LNAAAATVERRVITCNLNDADDVSEVGNKAYNLSRILKLGLSVPAGFVVTNAAFSWFARANYIDLEAESRPDLENASIPRAVLDQILELRNSSLPSGMLAVRSSAIGEDGADASFAGQLDSILHVETAADLERAVLACWSSYWNERVLSYQTARSVRLRGMAVIVQSQVASRISGVLFTQSPGGGAEQDQLCVEYCAGFGDAVVSGRVNPGRFRIAKADCRTTIDAAGDLDATAEAVLFDPHQIERLARAAHLLEQHFGRPQDIEWTIDDSGELRLLQSRPISVPASNSPFRILWSNANVNENFPEPISPFLYSIAREGYYHYFRNLALAFGISAARVRSMEPSLRYLVGVHHARIYYNLTHIHSVFRRALPGERLAGFFNDFVGADPISSSTPAMKRPQRFQVLELGRIATRTAWQFAFLTRRVEDFERVADDWAQTTRPQDLDHRSLVELRDMLRGFMEIRCHRWTNASLADAASMICYGILKLLLRSAYPGSEDSALHNNLLKALGVVSVQPAIQLWALSRRILEDGDTARWFKHIPSGAILDALQTDPQRKRLRAELDDYLGKWGFRFSGELMMTVPSLEENPLPLLDMLKTYLHAEGTAPIDSIRQLESEQACATARVLKDLRDNKRIPHVPRPFQACLVRLVLRATQRAIRLRERARSKQALLYNRCRRIALAIGDQLARAGTIREAGDVFFLTHTELDEFLTGHAMFPGSLAEMIALRKRAHHDAHQSIAPDTFNLAEGCYRVAEPNRTGGSRPAHSGMSGTGACGGQVTAPAAVLGSVADAHLLQVGNILVTRQTDPGWAPVFSLIRGLVIERGGMLSHGAIIAREFGLPCVVGVKGATEQIPQGALLSVDGDQGRVRIVVD